MSLVIFQRYNNIGEALVAYSTLEASGFHPSWHNYHHVHISYLNIIAFGGLIINIPEGEFESAHTLINQVKSAPMIEGDPLPDRKYGMWRNVLVIIAGYYTPWVIFAPLLWVRPKLTLLILALFITVLSVTAKLLMGINLDLLIYFVGTGLGLILLVLIAIWPLRTMLAYVSIWAISGKIYGFPELYTISLIYLIPVLILIHAKHVAVPRMKRRAHVT